MITGKKEKQRIVYLFNALMYNKTKHLDVGEKLMFPYRVWWFEKGREGNVIVKNYNIGGLISDVFSFRTIRYDNENIQNKVALKTIIQYYEANRNRKDNSESQD